MDPLEKAKLYIVDFFDKKIDTKYAYHNLDHTISVLSATQKITEKSQISDEEKLIVQLAALFHDTGFIDGPQDHEKRSAIIAENYLKANGFQPAFIDKVKACILATQMEYETSDHLAHILQDADMSGLASAEYFEITERLRKEKNNTHEGKISKNDWNTTNIQFLKKCKYKTKEGSALFKEKKDMNLEQLIVKSKADKKKKSKKNKKPSVPVQTIANNKSAQTQFKTALRNHIDLSNIADNKANIMISVNALILTVALPFMVDKAMDNNTFFIPTILMSAVCLVSMIYATLATRPIKMTGNTSLDQIQKNESNLFFFGNYFKMSYQEYKIGVDHILSDEKALDDSIIRDLFYLGKSLGGKFEYLRLCYTVFMYGILITVLSLLVVYFI